MRCEGGGYDPRRRRANSFLLCDLVNEKLQIQYTFHKQISLRWTASNMTGFILEFCTPLHLSANGTPLNVTHFPAPFRLHLMRVYLYN